MDVVQTGTSVLAQPWLTLGCFWSLGRHYPLLPSQLLFPRSSSTISGVRGNHGFLPGLENVGYLLLPRSSKLLSVTQPFIAGFYSFRAPPRRQVAASPHHGCPSLPYHCSAHFTDLVRTVLFCIFSFSVWGWWCQ